MTNSQSPPDASINNHSFPNVEMVFFDAGETLLRPHPSFSQAAADILTERGHSIPSESLEAVGKTIGRRLIAAADEGIMFSIGPHESSTFWLALYEEVLAQLRIDDPQAPAILYAHFSDPRNYGLFDDVEETLESLKARNLRLGVISNFESWLRGMLETLGILSYFEVVAISGDLGTEKPERAIFEWAVKQAKIEPSKCLHIGDSPRFDYDAASAAGLQAVLIDRSRRFDRPIRRRVDSLREIPALVG